MRELPNYFDEPVAATYDEKSADQFADDAVTPVIDLLAQLAGDAAALELGIGTGRIALPLAERGVRVAGIDLSAAMVARLRAKPGGAALEVVLGDFATARVGGEFAVVYLVFNTIMNLTSQSAQVACFRNAAAHLAPGGCFVVEVMVPELRRLPPGQSAVPFHVGEDRLGFTVYDVVNQHLVSYHARFDSGTGELRSVPFRYVWPAELDLMAELAGLTLRARSAGWRGEPFTSDSTSHVSIWRLPR